MEYGKIIAVTGLPGLYELLNSKNDGAIVRSLEDKSTKFVSSRIHNFSHLESIEVFTVKDNVNLTEIFHAMEKETSKIPDLKDGTGLKKYFEKVFPDIDFERVYPSDLKKMAKWFEILKENKIEIKLPEPAEEETTEEEEQAAGPATVNTNEKEKPAKKSSKAKEAEEAETPKKAAPKKTATAKAGEKEAAPPKKAVRKAAPKKKD